MAKKSSKKSGKKGAKRKKSIEVRGFSFKKDWPYPAIIVIVGLLFLWPVINADFTEMDDKKLILENVPNIFERAPRHVWKYSFHSPHYKPIVYASWLLEAKTVGLNASVTHFVNLLFHLFNSVLAFLLTLGIAKSFRQTSRNARLIALAAGAYFALHPMHVESVAWAMGRKDLFYSFFFLIGLLAYLRYLKDQKAKWMIFVTGAFGLSMLCKSPAVVFPFVLLLIDFAKKIPLTPKAVFQKWPVFVALLLGLYAFGVFGNSASAATAAAEGSIASALSNAPVSNLEPIDSWPSFYAKIALLGFKGVFWYLHSLLPIKLALAYPYKVWIPALGNTLHVFPLILAAAGALVFLFRNKYRFLFFTHAWFFIVLAPALVRTGLGRGIFVSDRYAYLALFGLLLFIAGSLGAWMARRDWQVRRMQVVFGAIGLIYGLMAFAQARLWDNGDTLWTNNIKHYPEVAYAYSNRGLYFDETGQPAKARADFSKAADIEDDIHALLRRATMLRQEGKYEEALADINRLLATSPGDSYALNAKGNIYFAQKQYPQALEVYNTGLALHPKDVSLLANRATTYFYMRQLDAALADFLAVESINPSYTGLYSKLTVVYNAKQDWPNVVRCASVTAQKEPNNHANLGDLGTALQRLGRHQEAVDAFSNAISVYPNGKRYYAGRARSYDALGNAAAAQNDRQKADSL